mmetsp:Transcript_21575/g.50301  ORF Transcript_21575/g.50301 Transcript_21575/m.50301 type:complete len:241 (-) Transcript_21575:362-1084(-)
MSPSLGTTTSRLPAIKQSRIVPAPACDITSAACCNCEGRSTVYSTTSTSSPSSVGCVALPRFAGMCWPAPRCTFSFWMPNCLSAERNSTVSTARINASNFVEPTVTMAVRGSAVGADSGRSSPAADVAPCLAMPTSCVQWSRPAYSALGYSGSNCGHWTVKQSAKWYNSLPDSDKCSTQAKLSLYIISTLRRPSTLATYAANATGTHVPGPLAKTMSGGSRSTAIKLNHAALRDVRMLEL